MARIEIGGTNHNIATVWGVQKEIIRLKALGMKNVSIAAELDITPQTVSNHLQNTIVQDQLKVLSDARDESVHSVRERLEHLSRPAVDTLEAVIDGSDEDATSADRIRASKEILDRAGYVSEPQANGAIVDADFLIAIKQRWREKSGIVTTTAERVPESNGNGAALPKPRDNGGDIVGGEGIEGSMRGHDIRPSKKSTEVLSGEQELVG